MQRIQRTILFGLLLCLYGSVLAAGSYQAGDGSHRLWLSVGGGGTCPIATAAPEVALRSRFGGDARLGVGYEWQKGYFLMGLGLEAAFDATRASLDSLQQTYDRRWGNEPIHYIYHYHKYEDRLRTVQVGVPIYVGASLGQYAYLHVGVHINGVVYSEHQTSARMDTRAVILAAYADYLSGMGEKVGIFTMPEERKDYTYRSRDFQSAKWSLTPMLEVGGNVSVSKKVEMRIGVYVGYDILFGGEQERRPLMGKQFDEVSTRPYNTMYEPSEQQAMLADILNAWQPQPLLYSDLVTKQHSNLVFGLKWTTLFDVSKKKEKCMCMY